MRDLASRLADDDQSAWAELYDATADALFHYVTVLVGNPDAATEVFQESFVRLYQSRQRLRDVEDLKAFVFTVVRNESNRWLRQNLKRGQEASIGESNFESACNPHSDDSDLIRYALRTLSNEEQELIQLKVYSQLTFQQVSEILGLPMGTCTSRYRRSLEKMRLILQEQIG